MAKRIVSHIRSKPNAWPRPASVGRETALSVWPSSVTTPAFMEVPPTSNPIKLAAFFMNNGLPQQRAECQQKSLEWQVGDGLMQWQPDGQSRLRFGKLDQATAAVGLPELQLSPSLYLTDPFPGDSVGAGHLIQRARMAVTQAKT